ncbi:cobalt transport protein [Streptomyces sp. NBRC 110611]|uniref:ABC transporter permease subunit n=1 Tax=Streptomyces sp. NBRC 110611 TaxID=1621259 RepID=UPI000833C823|nr:transmembrane transport protein [Streptomyces sp. NBRC 110611]GAU68671.1 cobalt transport protein [Streptomyces sp. NBRC 110611]
MTTTGAATTAATTTETTAAPSRTLLRGLPWLVWHRHRSFLRLALLATVAGCALFVYQRFGLMDFLHVKGSSAGTQAASHPADEQLLNEFRNHFGELIEKSASFLQYVPVIAGVFLGAPLIASEQEHGTLKLVSTQSAGQGRWLAVTLALPLAVVTVCTTLLSAAFTWLWAPAHNLAMDGDWLVGGAFDSTGPVPVAKALFLTACGIAIGMLIKRVVPAMAVTALLAFVFSVIWAEKVRDHLGTLRSLSYPYDAGGPDLPLSSVRIDEWLSTAGGKLYGIGTCTGADGDACRAKLGIVNRTTQYFDYGQMPGMQWLGAGILLALTAVVLAFVVWWARRRPL